MKNRRHLVAFILGAALATPGVISIGLLTTENYAFAQSNSDQFPKPSDPKQENTSNTDNLKKFDWTPLSIFVSAVIALLTYSVNESWKRRQYVEEKIKDFENRIETINVRKILSAELQCVELFPFWNEAEANHRFVVVKDCVWAEALLECKCNKTLEEQYNLINKDEPFDKQPPAIKASIRDNFNRFLNSLQQFEKMIKAGVLEQKTLKTYLESWFEVISKADNQFDVVCPTSGKMYKPLAALLEYMGLLKDTPEEKLSVVQKDVINLVRRYPELVELVMSTNERLKNTDEQTKTTEQCAVTPVSSQVV